MNRNKIIIFVGVVFTLMWVFRATYLVQYFPFTKDTIDNSQQLTKEAVQLPESLKESTVLQDKTAETIQKEIVTSLQLNWIKMLVLIIFGIISGCLLILHKPIGYLLSIFLSFSLIFYRLFNFYNSGEFSLERYALFYQYFPLNLIREVIMLLVSLITIVVLISIYVGEKLKRNEAR